MAGRCVISRYNVGGFVLKDAESEEEKLARSSADRVLLDGASADVALIDVA